MDDCAFCDIVVGKGPASIVYRDDQAVAFMVLRPITPGHLVVIPAHHAASLHDLDVSSSNYLFGIAKQLAEALRNAGVRCEGVNLFLADGAAAGQTVFHVHLHVFPRFAHDGFRTTADTALEVPRDELDRVAALIRRAYEAWSDDYK